MTTDIHTSADTAGAADTAPGPSSARIAARTTARTGRLRRLATVALAALLALAVWAAAVPIAGLQLVVGSGAQTQHVGPVSVALASLALGLLAWALLALLERRGPRGRRAWQIIGVLVLLGSLAGPLMMGGALPVLLTLEAMHLVVGATVIIGLAHRPQHA